MRKRKLVQLKDVHNSLLLLECKCFSADAGDTLTEAPEKTQKTNTTCCCESALKKRNDDNLCLGHECKEKLDILLEFHFIFDRNTERENIATLSHSSRTHPKSYAQNPRLVQTSADSPANRPHCPHV